MVFNRINVFRILFICVLSLIFTILLIYNNKPVETSLVKSILPGNIAKNTKIIPVLENSSSIIKIVFESDDSNKLSELKNMFMDDVEFEGFTVPEYNFAAMLDKYNQTPSNFISPKTRKLLCGKKYDLVYEQGLERLYNPIGISITEINRDPFMLLNDFLLQNNIANPNNFSDGKYYDTATIKIDSDSDWTNKNIAKLVKAKNKYSKNGNKIYLAGTPIHTYYTAIASSISINIICTLITILIIFLTYFYFKKFRLLIPIALSIAFGFLAGFSATKALYPNFHIITFLFGTTLIGIGIDYSYHYIFRDNSNKNFLKNLTMSLLSTVTAFSLLYLLKIDILSQIASFTITGLTAIHLFIVILYPAIDFPKDFKLFNPCLSKKVKIILSAVMSLVILTGLFKVKFNDSLTALYVPNKNLMTAEALFNKIANRDMQKSTIISVKGNSFQELLETEEKITTLFDEKGINYICISKFIPSIKRQEENYNLAKGLYINKLDKYNDILSIKQINELKSEPFIKNEFDINNFSTFQDLMLDDNTSLIISFSNNLPKINSENAEIIDFQTTVSNYLKTYRIKLLKIIPVIYLVLYFVLLLSYGFKQSVKMFAPIILSTIFVISFVSLLGTELNLFTILGLILILGFTTDYSIFSKNSSKSSLSAVFLACITTTLSFALLIFTTFKLISMLALTTSLGILSNYLFIKMLMKDDESVV